MGSIVSLFEVFSQEEIFNEEILADIDIMMDLYFYDHLIDPKSFRKLM